MQSKIIAKRLGAVTIDMMLISLLHVGIFFMLLRFGYQSKTVMKILTMSDSGLSYAFLFTFEAYYILQELFWNTTIGKKVFGLVVVSKELNKPSSLSILIRNLFRVTDQILGVGSLTMFFNKERRRLGDLVSKTVVVEKKSLVASIHSND